MSPAPRVATAPGKVLLAGEYAVLHGAPAVVMAVNRRARAHVAAAALPAGLSPFLAAARDELGRRFGADSREARAAARVVVDSSALAAAAAGPERGLGSRAAAGPKLGLGSSAAATVAAVAAALATGRQLDSVTDDLRREIHALAHRAHAAAQAPRGSRGSGADVAAATLGGVLRVVRPAGPADDDARPMPCPPLQARPLPWPDDLAFLLVWTRQPADTPALVARVRAYGARDPAGHDRALAALGDAGAALASALTARDSATVIRTIRDGARALAELGERAGAPLVPAHTAELERLAAALGGAAKPTGAGGGDLLVALVPRGARDELAARCRLAGLELVDAATDPAGVALVPEPSGAALAPTPGPG